MVETLANMEYGMAAVMKEVDALTADIGGLNKVLGEVANAAGPLMLLPRILADIGAANQPADPSAATGGSASTETNAALGSLGGELQTATSYTTKMSFRSDALNPRSRRPLVLPTPTSPPRCRPTWKVRPRSSRWLPG